LPKHSYRRATTVAVVAAVALAIVLAGPSLLDTYTVNVLVRSLLYAVAALTVDVLWGYTGVLSFGQSAFFGIGAYAAGLIFSQIGFSPAIAAGAFVVGLLVAAAVALVTGWISFFPGAMPLYAGVVTLALPIIVVQLLYSGGTITGSSSGLVNYDTFGVEVTSWFRIAGSGLVVITAITWLFVSSDFGRTLIAIRENETRATYLGINTSATKIGLMIAMAMVAAAAGYSFACYTMVVAPENAGFVFGTELLIWVALGGRGTLIGPILGAIAIDMTSAKLSGDLPYVWNLIVGIVFVAVIVALPQGLFPSLCTLFTRVMQRAVGALPASATVPALVVTSPASRAVGFCSNPALVVTALNRSYGSLQVLRDVSFAVETGELLSIVGPNGAGKTTLMRCLSNGLERTGGSVRIFGSDIGRQPPHRIVALGLGRSYQTSSLFETLTVAECLRLARHHLSTPSLFANAPVLPLPKAALRVVQATGLDALLRTEARHLSHGQKRALELAMVLAVEPSVLLLDEPTAGLTKTERNLIGSILAELTRRDGLCVLLIEHDLDFVCEISTRIIVLHQGAVLLDGSVQEVMESPEVEAIYAGQRAIPASGAVTS
jgi:branched-chain amino acid transport system permease protein